MKLMQTRANNFDILRLVGALLVALGHTMDVFLGYDGLGAATNNQSFGGLGLNIFCTISGFLITRSRLRNGPSDFFRSRALRIFPALVVAIPLMAFVVGPLCSSLPLSNYLLAPSTWQFLGSILIFPLNPSLPGVFHGAALIGQLYSLTAELGFYIFVGILGTWRHFPKLVAVLLLSVWTLFLLTNYVTLPFSQIFSIRIGTFTTFFFPLRLGFLCVFYLLSGSALALLNVEPAKLSRAGILMLGIWIVALCNSDRRVYDMIEMSLLPIAVLGIGMASRYTISIPERLGDISYGMYIYHFAVAQTMFLFLPNYLHAMPMVLLSIAVAALIAWVSFHLIEKRALARKSPRVLSAVADVSVAALAAEQTEPHTRDA